MKHTPTSTNLCKSGDKSLSKWDEAIAEAKRQIIALKKSIRSFEYFRDSGVRFPEPKKDVVKRKGRARRRSHEE